MPAFERERPAQGPYVRGYGEGGFLVEDRAFPAVLLTPERAVAWDPPPLAELGAEHLGPLLALDPSPEFLILGTGATMAFPPRTLARALDECGVGIEAMDSRAAARTWSLLRAEGRWIAAAIMPLQK